MPRIPKITVQNTFIQGLVTEATELNFPENACTETYNCIFEIPGRVRRRPGFDFESQYETDTQNLTGSVVVTFLWKNVAGEGDINFQVVQTGNTLHFYKVSSDESLSANKHTDTIDLLDFAPLTVIDVSTLECQFSFGNGLLFVTNEQIDTFYVEYDVDADTFTGHKIPIIVRDTEGDPQDPYLVNERPPIALGALNAFHRYNLENQGWTGVLLTDWDTARTDLPSNSDAPWYFKNTSEIFDFSVVADKSIGNSKAPRGHFTYNLYEIRRSVNTSGATDSIIDNQRFSTSAFFAGRVFYSGLKSTGYSSRIYFSQIVEDKSQYGSCYQVNDPTSEQLFDLLPSDGGLIDLIEAGQIIKMIPVLNTLVVICTNGVWAIMGSQGVGFTANDYSIQKVSSITSASAASFVDVEGIPYWWTLEGIYTITLDPQTNALRVASASDEAIKTFFDQIPLESRRFARGTYDSDQKVVQWIYKSRQSTSFSDKYVFDRMLSFDMRSKSWYPWSVSDSKVKIHAIASITGLSSKFTIFDVFNSTDDVFSGSDDVVAFIASDQDVGLVIKYFVSYDDTTITWADCTNTGYVDWQTVDATGTDYESYFITGYALRGEAMRKFQSNYIQLYHDTRYDGKFILRGIFDYARTPSGKWGTQQIITTTASQRPPRVKIRGHGLVCQYMVKNYLRNPFSLSGWAVLDTANRYI